VSYFQSNLEPKGHEIRLSLPPFAGILLSSPPRITIFKIKICRAALNFKNSNHAFRLNRPSSTAQQIGGWEQGREISHQDTLETPAVQGTRDA
jgi:DNA-binding transcriptional regulator YiaG